MTGYALALYLTNRLHFAIHYCISNEARQQRWSEKRERIGLGRVMRGVLYATRPKPLTFLLCCQYSLWLLFRSVLPTGSVEQVSQSRLAATQNQFPNQIAKAQPIISVTYQIEHQRQMLTTDNWIRLACLYITVGHQFIGK